MKPEDLSIAWLNDALAGNCGDARVTGFNVDDIGAGTGFGATVLRVGLEYDDAVQSAGDAPASIILKLPVGDEATLAAIREQGILREARFYAEIAPVLQTTLKSRALHLPQVYHVEFDGEDFAIAMADLGDIRPTGGIFESMPEAQVKQALIAVAGLHATFWNHPLTRTDWLRPIADGDAASRDAHAGRLRTAIDYLAQSPHDCGYTLDCAYRLLDLLPRAPVRTPLPKPLTLTHGDFHRNNLHRAEGGGVTLFDWQLVSRGTPAMDVANLLATSLDPAAYQRLLLPLLRTYHEALIAAGIDDYSWGQFRRGYRDALFFTFLKFLIVLGTINYDVADGVSLREAMIPRLNALAINADAKRYCQLMPLLFPVIKIINLMDRSAA